MAAGVVLLASAGAFAQTPAPQRPAPSAPAQTTPTPQPAGSQTPAPSVAPAVTTPQTPAAPFPADAKIGAVDLQAILAASKVGQNGQAQLKALSEKWVAAMKGLSDKFQALQQELQAQQSTLSSTALMQKRTDLNKVQLELQFQQQQRDSELQTLGSQLSSQFEAKVLPIIESIRKERGLWLVIEVGETPIAAIAPGLNLSPEVVKRLDAGQ
jgi:Skp family chaperone for outer membrane proteins